MSARAEVIATLTGLLPDLRQDLGVCTLWLFGSMARGEDTDESDVNVLVEFDRPASLFTLARVKHRLQAALRRDVELGTPDSLSKASRERVMKERVLVA
jgi:predicted nucleotidyltransferase